MVNVCDFDVFDFIEVDALEKLIETARCGRYGLRNAKWRFGMACGLKSCAIWNGHKLSGAVNRLVKRIGERAALPL
jgi:hypothetical protein